MALAPKGKIDQGQDIQGEINVTPLVDVMLVLLIIFMVVTPMLQKGVDVVLPMTSAPVEIPESAKQLEVAIKLDERVFINQQPLAKDAVLSRLRDEYQRNADREITLKADGRLKYAIVREMMQTINEAGFADVGLVTQKQQPKG